jgi:uncharacterized ParB-like nuclease family protein
MRAREFITELYNVPIHDFDLGSDLDVVKNMQHYRDNAARDAFFPDEREKGAQDFIGGGGIRQLRAVQNIAPSARGSFFSNPKHDTTPVIPINAKRVTNFEPAEKVQTSKSYVGSMVDHLKSGGQLPPIVVKPTKTGYEVIDGHHRLAAHQQAGSASIPAKIAEPQNVKQINDPARSFTYAYDKENQAFLKPGYKSPDGPPKLDVGKLLK